MDSPDQDRCELLCVDLPKAKQIQESQPTASTLSTAAEQAKALGDPTRFAVAAALAQTDELCVCDVAWILERSDKLISHHLRALRQSGLTQARRDGKMVIYSLTETGRTLTSLLLELGSVSK